MKMLKVRAIRGFCIGSGRDLMPGDIGELPEREALERIRQGKAELVVAKASSAKAPENKTPEGGKNK